MRSELESVASRAPEEERRADLRRRSLKGALLTFNHGYSAFECVVRNQSAGGLRLSMAETFAVPKVVDLSLSGEPVRRAEVVWRSMSEIGIRYVS